MAEARPKILVVDDSRTQLDRLVKVLEREGFDVRAASTGNEALVKVRTDPPDLVLLDMILPDMDGLKVLLHVKKAPDERFIPVIILSVKSDLGSKLEGLRLGAGDFLAKPFEDLDIGARVNAMLHIKSLQD